MTFHRLIESFQRRRQVRENMQELERLSDRHLADIGLSRGDIPYIAKQSAEHALSGRNPAREHSFALPAASRA